MIISSLISGTGNQMFQYAAGYALAARRGVPFRLDLRNFDTVDPTKPPRPYNLNRFSISAGTISASDRLWLAILNEGGRTAALKRVVRKLPLPHYHLLADLNRGYDARVINAADRTYLVGFWECERYFSDYRQDILKEFAFRDRPDEANETMLRRIQVGPSVCVHVRRGDLTNPANHVRPCPIEYYDRGIAHINEAVPGANFFIFSDDPEWTRANLRVPAGSTFVTHNVGVSDVEDLRLMTACSHFIIANSTFSWWGAWLSQHPAKVIVAPARWFAVEHGNESDIVPAGWIRL